jgi:hypothetical protein
LTPDFSPTDCAEADVANAAASAAAKIAFFISILLQAAAS